MLRSTRHHILDANLGKLAVYQSFIEEYSRVAKIIMDAVWEILPEDLNLPLYLNYKGFPVKTNLSARVLSSVVTQVSGIIRSVIGREKCRIWVRKNKGIPLIKAKFRKPKISFIFPELSSKCCDVRRCQGKFWGFVRLKCLGSDLNGNPYGTICLPIIKNPRIEGELQGGIKFFKQQFQLVWKKLTSSVEKGNKIIGADTGLKAVLSLSDGQTPPIKCPHGHSYESILTKLSRKKRGGASFKKAQAHRKNFINWSVNQLNFRGVKEVRLEKVTNIRYGRKSSRKLSHWSNPEIRDKLKSRCEELEVPVIEQSCVYRSQRCSQCGQVRKANRQSKHYNCKFCGYSADADFNAAVNHSLDLPAVPKEFAGQKLNLGHGFFWKPTGFYTFSGAELRVPFDTRNNSFIPLGKSR